MLGFIIKRSAYGMVVLWAVASLTFILLRITPGGPFDRDRRLPPRVLANIEAKYQLDKPWLTQYTLYLRGLIRGDLGPSYKYVNRTVNDIVRQTLPISAKLGLAALLFALVVAFPLGLIAGYYRDTWVDRAALSLATLGISVPSFILAAALIWLFALQLRWLPAGGWGPATNALLPAITLGAAPAAYLAYLIRSSIVETMNEDFIRTARAKGLTERAVVLKHATLNSLNPVLSVMGPLLAALVTGSFVVEYVFAIPGIGRFFITAVTDRDYPTIMGVTLIYTGFVVVANLIVDLCYSITDPRVRTN
jgi:oligopeptide transport system permease protein